MFIVKEYYCKQYAFTLLTHFVVQKFTNFIVKKFHCKKISQKMLLKNFTKNVAKKFDCKKI